VTSNYKDIQLIAKVKLGDTSAFRALVEKYKDVSFTLACSILKNEKNAEDALQDSFVKVYKNIHAFKSNALFSTWLYKIVVNTSLNLLKKEKRFIHDSIDIVKSNNLGIADTDANLVNNNRTEIIKTVLDDMTPNESLLLRLYYLSELDINEIKKITGFGVSKIKTTLFRARKNLHTALKTKLGNEIKHLI